MDDPVRVLHVIAGMGSGGAEAFIMNMYRHMDHEKVQFDFLLRSSENMYEEELRNSGSRIFCTSSFPRHAWRNYREVKQFLSRHKYQIVHVHQNALLYMTALEQAKKAGVPCRIMHSHNTSMAYKQLLPIHLFNKGRIHRLATDCFACSEGAGEWMFGEGYTVIRNAIDIEKFRFDPAARERIRAEFGISGDTFVVGHVGRFWEQKNHVFLVETFLRVLEKKPDAVLFLVGSGGREEEIKKLVQSLSIADRVVFAGVRSDVHLLMSAFDVFAFPSLYEGLGIVAVEAQANGMPAVCSEAVPASALFTQQAKTLSLSAGAEAWCEQLLAFEGKRYDAAETIREAGYDICEEAKKLQDFYCSAVK